MGGIRTPEFRPTSCWPDYNSKHSSPQEGHTHSSQCLGLQRILLGTLCNPQQHPVSKDKSALLGPPPWSVSEAVSQKVQVPFAVIRFLLEPSAGIWEEDGSL